MVSVNGVVMPMRHQSGLLVMESPSGHQSWALIADATVEYGDAEFTGDEPLELRVIVTLPPGELLRTAQTEEVDEPNVLTYSRLLVHVLREERERYAELEKELGVWRRTAQDLRERVEADERDRDEMLRAAWADGARNGYVSASAGLPVEVALERNPHPEPDDTSGCHICGGPDH